MLIFLNREGSTLLVPYKSGSNKPFLAQAYADDLNVMTPSLTTLLRIFRVLEDYRLVSGLKLNLDKTYGYFFNKTYNIELEHLPLVSKNWNRNRVILGIPYGTKEFVEMDIVEKIKKSLNYYKEVSHTFDAKSIITNR